MKRSYKTLHNDFRLNGLSYSKEELKDLGYGLVKEGEGFEKAIGNFLLDWLDENDGLEVNTSGSTGEPRKISLKKVHMVNSALATGEFFNLKPKNSALLCLSTNYIAGKMMLVRAIALGLDLDYIEPSSNPLESISKKYDFCAMVPLQLENSLEKIDRIKTLIVGGAALSSTLKNKLQYTSSGVFETYGMTETITHVAVRDVRLSAVEAQVNNGFKALPDVIFAKDERDCLIISAPKISDKQIVTNDIVDLISDSEFEWLGRFDNVINSGGVKLFTEQIEAKLGKLIENRFFITGIPDERLGQKLVLILEGETDIDKLNQTLKKESDLEHFEIPRYIYSLPRFVETDTGKIRRKENLRLIKK